MKDLLIIIFFLTGCLFIACEKSDPTEAMDINNSVNTIETSLSKSSKLSESRTIRFVGHNYFKIPKGTKKIYVSFGSRKTYTIGCTISEFLNGHHNLGNKSYSISSNGTITKTVQNTTDEIDLDISCSDVFLGTFPSALEVTVGY